MRYIIRGRPLRVGDDSSVSTSFLLISVPPLALEVMGEVRGIIKTPPAVVGAERAQTVQVMDYKLSGNLEQPIGFFIFNLSKNSVCEYIGVIPGYEYITQQGFPPRAS